MTTWSPISLPPAPTYTDVLTGAILLESGFPDYLLQEDGFPPIRILLEGSDNSTIWTPIVP
jgi:hypothetical protein